MLKRYLVIVVPFIFLYGCVNNIARQPAITLPANSITDTEAPAAQEGAILLPSRTSHNISAGGNDAVDQLLMSASEASINQQLARASALIERAVRLSPQDPRVYFSLAQVRFKENRSDQAYLLLKKSQSLVINDLQMLDAIKKFRASMK